MREVRQGWLGSRSRGSDRSGGLGGVWRVTPRGSQG